MFDLRKIIIIPTYNEIENIANLIDDIIRLKDYNILVVDDNSPDGTAKVVQKYIDEKIFDDKIHLLNRKQKSGLGPAYLEGFKWSLKNGFDYIYQMDADFSHQPKNLKYITKELDNGSDVVIGSRYIHGVNVVNWPMNRVLLSYIGSKYVKLITRLPVEDPTAGYVAYKKEILSKIIKNNIKFKGYGFQIEMKYKAWKLGAKITEVTNIFINRKLGNSKMHFSIVFEAIFGIYNLIFWHLFNKKR